MRKSYSDCVGKRKGQVFDKLVTRYERIGDDLVEIPDKFDVDKEVNSFADCALDKVLDRFLDLSEVNLGSGFRKPDLEPSDLGEIKEVLSEISDAGFGEDMDGAFEFLKKGGENIVETQKVESQSEQKNVPSDGAEDAQA